MADTAGVAHIRRVRGDVGQFDERAAPTMAEVAAEDIGRLPGLDGESMVQVLRAFAILSSLVL